MTLTKTQAQAAYLAMVEPFNDASSDLEQDWDGTDLEETQQAIAALATASREFSADLLSTPWPANAQSTADDLVAALAAAQPAYRAVLDATSMEELLTASAPLEGLWTESSGIADLMRVRLGLPSVLIEQ